MAETTVDVEEELEQLRAENEALKKSASSGLSLKVSEKGGVSVYGLGRFPVTLYKEQWVKLLAMADEIRTFITRHESDLKKGKNETKKKGAGKKKAGKKPRKGS